MTGRSDLQHWLEAALRALGGSATLVEVSKEVWKVHEQELRAAGELFYTWQYDIRWAANRLRKRSVLRSAEVSPRGVWELT